MEPPVRADRTDGDVDLELEPAPPRPPRRTRRARVLLTLGIVASIAILSAAAVVAWADRQFDEIPTFTEDAPGYVEVSEAPGDTSGPATSVADLTQGVDAPAPVAPPAKRGVTYLLFSTGSERLDAATAQRLGIPADRASMRDGLTDSILLVVTYPDTGQVGVLSIPRDLYVPQINDRINTIYVRSGPRALATMVGRITGLPVDHMVAVNFAAFGDLTDAVGGVDVWVDGPARDLNTGFAVDQSGCVHMDAAMALAYARSRHWEVSDGVTWRLDASADDFGRIRRQQTLIRAATRKLGSPAGLGSLPAAVSVAQRDLIVDAALDFRQVSGVALDLIRSDQTTIQTFSYAGTPGWAGAASVVYTDARANAGPLSAMQRLLAGQPVDASAGGSPAPPSAGPVVPPSHTC